MVSRMAPEIMAIIATGTAFFLVFFLLRQPSDNAPYILTVYLYINSVLTRSQRHMGALSVVVWGLFCDAR